MNQVRAKQTQRGPTTTHLAEELRRKARQLISAGQGLISLATTVDPDGEGEDIAKSLMDPGDNSQIQMARHIYRSRQIRNQYFSSEDLFGEPAWDILLDLFIAENEGKRVPVTSACIGSSVPTTTALRWLTILEVHELLMRENDPSDARRVFVHLTS